MYIPLLWYGCWTWCYREWSRTVAMLLMMMMMMMMCDVNQCGKCVFIRRTRHISLRVPMMVHCGTGTAPTPRHSAQPRDCFRALPQCLKVKANSMRSSNHCSSNCDTTTLWLFTQAKWLLDTSATGCLFMLLKSSSLTIVCKADQPISYNH